MKEMVTNARETKRAMLFHRADGFFQFYTEILKDLEGEDDVQYWSAGQISGIFESLESAKRDVILSFGEFYSNIQLRDDEFDLSSWGNIEPKIKI